MRKVLFAGLLSLSTLAAQGATQVNLSDTALPQTLLLQLSTQTNSNEATQFKLLSQ